MECLILFRFEQGDIAICALLLLTGLYKVGSITMVACLIALTVSVVQSMMNWRLLTEHTIQSS